MRASLRSKGLPKGPQSLLKGSEGLPEGPESLPEGPEGLAEGPGGLTEGPEGLPEGLEGLPGVPGGTDVRRHRQTIGQMDGRTDRIFPHSTGVCPLSGPLPCYPLRLHYIKEAGQGYR